jgi:hypothetical protein
VTTELGNGPEDWGDQYPASEAADLRWALPGFAILRGLVTWITGRDPVVERRRRELAREQSQGLLRYERLERDAFRRLGEGIDRPRGD